MSLERDDRGETNDFIRVNGQKMWSPIRQEIVSIRGIVAGEYTVNVHLYQHTAKAPVPVSVTVEKLNPAVSVIYYDTIDLDHTDEEKTAVRFTLAEDGSVVRTSSTQKSLLDTIAWKRTFRIIRRESQTGTRHSRERHPAFPRARRIKVPAGAIARSAGRSRRQRRASRRATPRGNRNVIPAVSMRRW